MTWQPAAVEPVDVELRATAYLRANLPGVHVGVSRPTEATTPYPERVVSVRRDGGPIDGVLDRARIGLNAWAPTRKDARDLAADAVRLLLGWPATLATDAPVMARCTMAPSIVSDDEPPHFYAVLALTFRAV